jgi:PAS domain S-box-containing protein
VTDILTPDRKASEPLAQLRVLSDRRLGGLRLDTLETERKVALSALLEALPLPAFEVDRSGTVVSANGEAERLLGLSRERLLGSRYDQPALDVAGVDGEPIDFDRSPIPRALAGEIVRDYALRTQVAGRESPLFLCVNASPIVDERGAVSGALVTVHDITEQHLAKEQTKRLGDRLEAVLNNTTMAVFVMDERQHCIFANAAAEQMTGYGFHEMQGRPLHDVVHHTRPDGSHFPLEECPIDRAFPEDLQMQGEETFVHADGSFYPVAFTASPIRDDASRTVGTIIEVRNIEEERRRRSALQILSRTASAVAGELDLDRLVQTVVDAGVEISGAGFGAFFYNVLDEAGARYTLYALSGAPRSAFEQYPMPRATAVFHPTFAGEGVVLSADILQDERYGKNEPHQGMPAGHLPVRSYLAVPVKSRSGEVLGGLFFGHPEPGVFGQNEADWVESLANHAAVAIDNAGLFKAGERELARRVQAEAELRDLNADLERRVAEEVAERSKAEEALRQAQKMEAIGQLTGGVAHDFNNLLTVIMGGLDTIRRTDIQDGRLKRAADLSWQGAQRAAALTDRLLAFSRRQPLQPRTLDLNLVVRDLTELLHRTLGEQVELEGVLAPRLWSVEVDPNQFESALVNLAINARDAMPGGGKLTIETSNAALDEGYQAIDAEVKPGQYVMVSISDTGSGMDQETLTRVFEPFFTTKEVGKGTGLGLSMVYGFVKQSGGHVTIYSEVEVGTTVKLYFPRHYGDVVAKSEATTKTAIPRAVPGEVIVLVEDNDDVRAYSSSVLRELGYHVLEAADAVTGLAVLREAERVDLLFTDVVLPGPSGRALADSALELLPGLRVLFTTGYSRNAIIHHGRLDPGVDLISKPFTFEQLACRVRDVLDRRG